MGKKSKKVKLMEGEDYHLFGQVFLIIAGVLIGAGLVRLIDLIPSFTIFILIGLGYLFARWGIKILRKEK